MAKANLFYAQSGGVTPVINASACGVIETARQHKDRIGKIFAGRNGIIGGLREELIDTGKESAATIALLRQTPAGAFGSCRYKLKNFADDPTEYHRLMDVFRAHNIRYFLYNGGGDSQDTANKLAQFSLQEKFPITCIGIPKTVDNDLPITTPVRDSARWRNMWRSPFARLDWMSPPWRKVPPRCSCWK